MKIDNEALKKHYDNFLEAKSFPARSNCPSPELLLKSLRTSRRKNRKIIKHFFSCVYCSREFEFMFKTIRKETEITQDLDQLLLQTPDKKKSIKGNKTTTVSSVPKKLLYSTTGVLIIALVLIFFLKIPKDPQFRKTRASPIHIEFPNEAKLHRTQLYFEWGNFPKSDYYIIEVFDETLLQIWMSEKLTNSPYHPTEDLLNKLDSNQTYFWMVTAYSKNKIIAESRLIDFFLNK